jgi:uncharacterized membrane protein YfhO
MATAASNPDISRPQIRNRIKEFLFRNRYLFLAYGTVCVLILVIYAIIGVYPFGDKTILKSDLFHSYAPTFNDVYNKARGGMSLIYSWNGSLGGDLLSSIITIMSCPLNLLMFLFPVKATSEFFALLILLKIPCAAVTFFIFAREKFPQNKDISTLAFSVLYAFSAYLTVYHWNPMWLDSAIALPVVILGLERIFTRRSAKLYCLALAYGIISSYGTGFQLCVFSVMYFIAALVLRPEAAGEKIRKFFAYSLLAGLLCAVWLLPTIAMLPATQYTAYAKLNFPQFAFYFSPTKFLINHFWGVYPTNMVFSDSVPNIYAGVLSVLLAPLFFLTGQVKRREKLVYAALLLALFLCFDINILTYFMHGLHFPSMMPHRYSYIYSFVLLLTALRVFPHIKEFKYKTFLIITAGAIVALGALYLLHGQDPEFPKPGRLSLNGLIMNAVIVAVYGAVLVLGKRFPAANSRKIMSIVLAVLVIAETGSNGYLAFSNMGDGQREHYVIELFDDMSVISQRLKEEPEFYRAEFKHFRTLSDSRVYDYNGFTSFSGLPADMMTLMNSIGVTTSSNLMVFANPTPVLMSLFSQKYLFNKNAKLQESFTTFEYKYNVGKIYLYENPNVLPLGFMVSENLQNWDITQSKNPFVVQNDLLRKSLDDETDVFSMLAFDTLDREYITLTEKDDGYSYVIDDELGSDTVPRLTFRYIAPKSKWTYFHLRTGGATAATVRVNGRDILRQTYRIPATSLDAGFVNEGDEVEIAINMDRRTNDEKKELIKYGTVEMYAAQMDFAQFRRMVTTFSENPFVVKYYDNTHVRGTITADGEGLMFTSIPYSPNWRITVDGKAIEPRLVGGALIALKLFPGEHEIEFTYRAGSLLPGCIISLLSAFLFAGLWIYGRRRENRRITGQPVCERADAAGV